MNTLNNVIASLNSSICVDTSWMDFLLGILMSCKKYPTLETLFSRWYWIVVIFSVFWLIRDLNYFVWNVVALVCNCILKSVISPVLYLVEDSKYCRSHGKFTVNWRLLFLTDLTVSFFLMKLFLILIYRLAWLIEKYWLNGISASMKFN